MTCKKPAGRIAVPGYPSRMRDYVSALQAVGLEPVVTVDREEACGCDGLLLPGGGDIHPNRYGQENRHCSHIDLLLDELRFSTLATFLSAGKPVLGICQGMQLINVYLGGDLIQDLPTRDTHVSRNGEDSLHPLHAEPGSFLHRIWGEESIVNSSHHQALGTVAPGLTVTAHAPDGVPEAVEHETLPLLGVQFHPERMLSRTDCADSRCLFEWLRDVLR